MRLREAQIVCIGLAGGMLVASVVMGGLAYAKVVNMIPGLLPPLAGAVALAFPACLLAGLAVRSSMLQQARLAWLKDSDGRVGESIELFEAAYARAAYIQCAAFEGFGLLGAVAALFTGQLLFLAAPAIAIVGIGVAFPSETKFRATTDALTRPPDERELRLVEALRERDDADA